MKAEQIIRSPSGLFTRAVWERELESGTARMPRWYRSAERRDRRFLAWVHAEALGLAAHLAGLNRHEVDPLLGTSVDRLVRALVEDAEWARGRLDDLDREAA